jgi:hypothetical protein
MLVQPKRRHIWLIAVIVVVVLGVGLLLVTGQVSINGPPPGTGDPGNKRLRELRNDPVFSHLPDGAHLKGSIVETPAHYRQPVLEGGGWETPTVGVTFVDDQPPATIYQFYAAQAAATGWQVSHYNQLGYAYRWTKTYPDHANAWLILSNVENTSQGQGQTYEFGGGISIIQ